MPIICVRQLTIICKQVNRNRRNTFSNSIDIKAKRKWPKTRSLQDFRKNFLKQHKNNEKSIYCNPPKPHVCMLQILEIDDLLYYATAAVEWPVLSNSIIHRPFLTMYKPFWKPLEISCNVFQGEPTTCLRKSLERRVPETRAGTNKKSCSEMTQTKPTTGWDRWKWAGLGVQHERFCFLGSSESQTKFLRVWNSRFIIREFMILRKFLTQFPERFPTQGVCTCSN